VETFHTARIQDICHVTTVIFPTIETGSDLHLEKETEIDHMRLILLQ
jgi:hypothetical protein